jgi:hypothetical protein
MRRLDILLTLEGEEDVDTEELPRKGLEPSRREAPDPKPRGECR